MTAVMRDNRSLEQIDRETVFHPFTHLKDLSEGRIKTRIMDTGQGCTIVDHNGRSFIEAFSGLYCVNVGYGREEIATAIHEQARRLAFYQSYAATSTEPLIRLSDRLVKMAPGDAARVFYGMSGSDANETNVKLSWYYNNALNRPRKKKIIARERGYHGSSIFSGSMTGLTFYHKNFDLPVNIVKHTIAPDYWRMAAEGESELEFSARCAQELDALILREGPDSIAAFIAEPVLGTGGLTPPPEGYFESVRKVLDRYDILLIVDEVITGFGRTGRMFGSELYDLEPDLMTLAKGLTSAYVPLSASIVSDRVWRVIEGAADEFGPFSHGYTYSGHPLGAAAANATLDIVERENLPENAGRMGLYLIELLREAFEDHPNVGQVRGIGLMAAVEFVENRTPRRFFEPGRKIGPSLAAACVSEGLIVRAMPHGDILDFSPPLIADEGVINEIVRRTRRAVERVLPAPPHA